VLLGLTRIFAGAAFTQVLAECEAVHKRILQGACSLRCTARGDGNVHTNIPVTRTTTPCCTPRARAVARIMGIARELDGVISGEHGSASPNSSSCPTPSLPRFVRTNSASTPKAASTSSKLMPHSDLRRAYTPSFGLLGHESLIMQHSDISTISDAIKDCLRCGKCKPVCATHVPRGEFAVLARDRSWRPPS